MKLAKFLADRPWIWIIVGYVFLTGCVLAGVVVMIKAGAPTVPLEGGAK